jgi:hypothetical protein
MRRRHVEQHWQVNFLQAWLDGVTKPDVYYDVDLCAGESRHGAQSQSAIVQFLPYLLESQVVGVECDAIVFDYGCADFSKDGDHCAGGWIAKSEQVQIASRALRFVKPCR